MLHNLHKCEEAEINPGDYKHLSASHYTRHFPHTCVHCPRGVNGLKRIDPGQKISPYCLIEFSERLNNTALLDTWLLDIYCVNFRHCAIKVLPQNSLSLTD